jgi:hypothetical protein
MGSVGAALQGKFHDEKQSLTQLIVGIVIAWVASFGWEYVFVMLVVLSGTQS